jgi:hypothetical protein
MFASTTQICCVLLARNAAITPRTVFDPAQGFVRLRLHAGMSLLRNL